MRCAKRMFFGCTHVTLRASEVPVWLDVGMEVVPEEVDTCVMNRMEALTYDDHERHEVLQRCRHNCTLPQQEYDAARRVRLRQRKGLLSQKEQDFFNARFDVIYVATDLETAVNVKSWFSGDVVYRYFGKFDYLMDIRDLAKSYSREQLRNIICLPIFDSLYELDLLSFFDRCATVHGYVPEEKAAKSWQGIRTGQSAVVVMNNVREGNLQCEMLRRMFNLARDAPITVLGKNPHERVPMDVMANINVTGMLERSDFWERMSGSRMLIHPFAERHHNHYTNLEAIAAGIPVLFRSDNPLFIEQPAELRAEHSATWYGAYASEAELFSAVTILFDQPEQLTTLAQRQRVLLDVFSQTNVEREARAASTLFPNRFRKAIHLRKSWLSHHSNAVLHAKIPCIEAFTDQARFYNCDQIIPLHAFSVEDDWNLLVEGMDGEPVLRFSHGARQFIIGSDNDVLKPGRYRLDISGRIPSGSSLMTSIEMFQEEALVATRQICISSVEGPALCSIDLNSDQPWRLSLWFNPVGGHSDIATLKLVKLDGEVHAPAVSTDRDAGALIIKGLPVPVAALADGRWRSQLRQSGDICAVVIDRHREALHLVIGNDGLLAPGTYQLRLEGLADDGAALETEIEIFQNEIITARLKAFIVPERQKLSLIAELQSDKPWALALHLSAVGPNPVMATKIFLTPLSDESSASAISSDNLASNAYFSGTAVPIHCLLPNEEIAMLPWGELQIEGLPIREATLLQIRLPEIQKTVGSESYTLICQLAALGQATTTLILEVWNNQDVSAKVELTVLASGDSEVELSFSLPEGGGTFIPILFLQTSTEGQVLLTHAALQRGKVMLAPTAPLR
jgi:hypothetical protein